MVLKLVFLDPLSPHIATFQIADMVLSWTFLPPPPPLGGYVVCGCPHSVETKFNLVSFSKSIVNTLTDSILITEDTIGDYTV